jgi:hypothetical protein
MMMTTEAKAWIRRGKSEDEIVRILPDVVPDGAPAIYHLFTAFDEHPTYLGKILFDVKGYWIYDGEVLQVAEQEQLANFIINYKGAV